MARSDYRCCDVCGEKAFYDSDLSYDYYSKRGTAPYVPYLVAGEPQYTKPEYVEASGLTLHYLGDWAVLCNKCSKTHVVRIEKRVPVSAATNKPAALPEGK